MIDDILEQYNIKYEDLNAEERETLHAWSQAIQNGEMTTDKIRDHVNSMKDAVERELASEPEHKWIFFRNDRNILLKARLKNYLLLGSFLLTPEKIKQMINSSVSQIAGKKVK